MLRMDWSNDIWLPRLAIGGLVSCMLASVVGIAILSVNGHEIPAALSVLAGTLAGGLTGLLAPVPGNGHVTSRQSVPPPIP